MTTNTDDITSQSHSLFSCSREQIRQVENRLYTELTDYNFQFDKVNFLIFMSDTWMSENICWRALEDVQWNVLYVHLFFVLREKKEKESFSLRIRAGEALWVREKSRVQSDADNWLPRTLWRRKNEGCSSSLRSQQKGQLDFGKPPWKIILVAGGSIPDIKLKWRFRQLY